MAKKAHKNKKNCKELSIEAQHKSSVDQPQQVIKHPEGAMPTYGNKEGSGLAATIKRR